MLKLRVFLILSLSIRFKRQKFIRVNVFFFYFHEDLHALFHSSNGHLVMKKSLLFIFPIAISDLHAIERLN